MALFIQYIIRLSVSFAVMYLFYEIVLRRLTFYNHNRWYLLGYSVLCFFIPLINISSFSSAPQQSEAAIMNTTVVRMIPNVAFNVSPETQAPRAFNAEQIITWIFFIGIAGMLVRLLLQLIAYKKMTKGAKIISDDDTVKLYQVDKEIVPFSFGNSVFINRDLHNENALQEILKHEFVHVKQKHTLDILWGEILCIFNWYNPFVWLIRKAIRENLEFIADDKVVQSGINKQQYQYLLLRVMGNNNFSITNNFNFSSIKKRITMMNKIKTAKIHLLKFLFLIPLLGILLVSFRDVVKTTDNDGIVTFSGMVVNERYQPLGDVLITDSVNGISETTDANGFYSLKVDLNKKDSAKVTLSVIKNGFENFTSSMFEFSKNSSSKYIVVNMGIRPINYIHSESTIVPFAAFSKSYANSISNAEIEKQLRKSISDFESDVLADKKDQVWADSIEGTNYNRDSGTIAYFRDSSMFMTNGVKVVKENVQIQKNKELVQVQVEAKFPGGNRAWIKYLQLNLKQNVPVDNGAPAGTYKVVVSFLVNKYGEISEVKAISAPQPDYGTAAEAVRVIEKGPKWIPAIQDGHAVTCRQKQAIVFNVTGNDSKKK